jgi:hypothetical protein
MMGERQGRQERLFYEFCLEDRIPADHLLREIDKVLVSAGCARSLRHSIAIQAVRRSIRS